MKQIKPAIIIGVPAYNEERNIARLLRSIVAQKQSNFTISGIYVVSDASDDNTDSKALRSQNPLVTVVRNVERKGKTYAIKKLLSIAREQKAPYLMILDADLTVEKKDLIQTLLTTIEKDAKISSVNGFAHPAKPKNIMQKIAHHGFYVWERTIENNLHVPHANYFKSSDAIIMLRVSHFPAKRIEQYSYMHDEFYYLYALTHKTKFGYVKNAKALYNTPKTLSDYVLQMSRYVSKHIDDTFPMPKDIVIPSVSPRQKIRALFEESKDKYVISFFYLLMQVYINLLTKIKSQKIDAAWKIVATTK